MRISDWSSDVCSSDLTMENFALGLSVALLPQNLLACFAGVFVGTAIGAIPGIGALAAISLLMPLTFAMDPTTGIVMLAGVYYGAEYGGSISSILLNVPGTPANAITCLEDRKSTRLNSSH